MKVIIIGAGIGGVAAAVILHRAGHEVTVYEQGERLRTHGNGVLIYPNGTGILRELGLPPRGLGVPMSTLDLLAEDGKVLMRLKFAKIAKRYGRPVLVGRRGDVLTRLAGLLPDGMIRFCVRCTGIKQGDGDTAHVHLENGDLVEADLVVGADGHRSMVRGALIGGDPAAYTGDATWHGMTRLPGAFANGDRVHSLYGREGICVMHPVGGGVVYWAFELPWKDGDVTPPGRDAASTGPSAVQNLRDRFGHWTVGSLPQLLDTITDDEISVFPHIIHTVPDVWGEGPVTLIGDAVHAVPPRVGMGLNQALEDAWVLGRALEGPGPVERRVRAYERVRLPRMKRMHKIATVMGRKTLPLPLGLLRAAGERIPMTAIQTAQVKALSNYLNDDVPG